MQLKAGAVPQNTENLEKIIDKHPFTHQLDVILTAEERARSLVALETSYYRTKATFSDLYLAFSASSTTTAFTLGSPTTDAWCLDRGILSLSLTQDTYERLGIGVGTRVGSVGCNSRFLVQLDLHDRTSPLAVRARGCLQQWDIRRATEEDQEGWDVLLHPVPEAPSPEAKQNVRALLQTTANVFTPQAFPAISSDDVHEDLAEFFEWVGLASLGSQRLLVGDSVNPYAASYEPPLGSSVAKIFHLRWSGFLSPAFVHCILKEVLERSDGVRAMSALSFDAPVSPASCSGAAPGGENVWTLIASEARVPGSASSETRWALVENTSK
ncbi:hypothetical protein JB92DRAFT_2987006 [Gautieria morchelliformis]|nr:hypothetical protein JB92DRAFT_2987006 [Gautieria morchelliformis]